MPEFIILRLFIDIYSYRQINNDCPLTSINTLFQYPHGLNRPFIHSLFLRQIMTQTLFVDAILRQHSYLIFINHTLLFFSENLSKKYSESLFYFSYRQKLYIQFRNIKSLQVMFGNQHLTETQFLSFRHSLFNPVDRSDFTT